MYYYYHFYYNHHHYYNYRYQLNLAVIKGLVKESLESYINNNPNVKVSFLGVRKSDPAGLNVKPFQVFIYLFIYYPIH